MLPDSFSSYLKEELARRKARNNAYSLRSFGKSLGINHSGLSQIINDKRPLTEKMIRRLALRLNLGPTEVSHFINQLRRKKSKKIHISEDQLSLDSFAVISDWYHYAILELIRLPDFRSDTNWISKKLSISREECELALERLIRLKMIEVNEDDELIDLTQGRSNCTHHVFTDFAKKKYQKQTFDLALKAIDDVDIDKRSHSGMTFAMNSEQMEKYKVLINEFKWKLSNLMLTGKKNSECDLDSVYHLSIGLFPMTKASIEKNAGEQDVY